jgi:hypothetical protein
MFECLILGDIIAVGLGQARPECVTIARSGITSEKWVRGFGSNPFFKDDTYKVAIISLGTNDTRGMTSEMLYLLRKEVKAKKVIWILPSYSLKPIQRSVVTELSNEFKDTIIDISQYLSRDGIHPNSLEDYKKIADKTK